jgi:undecaprenyl-diphosphatase
MYISIVDTFVYRVIEKHQNIILGYFFHYFSYSASSLFLVLVIVFIWVIRKRVPSSLVLASAISLAVTYILKYEVGRIRPIPLFFLESPLTPAFPSGHTTVASVLSIHLFRMAQNRKLIRLISVIYLILSGFARMYLGVHYLSDVLVGYFVGFVGYHLASYTIRKLERK